jgi:hypothetical protein
MEGVMKHARIVVSALVAPALASLASAMTITGITPSAVKVKVRQPITFTLTGSGVPTKGFAQCFFVVNFGDGDAKPGPEDLVGGSFAGGSANLEPFSYSGAGTFTVTVSPRQAGDPPYLPGGTVEEWRGWEFKMQGEGVQPCDGSASATVTVWDPYSVHHRVLTNLPPGSAALKGPSKPGGGPVETTELKPGSAVALNPQPLPPGPMHTESLRTGAGATGGNGATMVRTVPLVRSVALTPSPVHEGQPVQIAITADQGCNAVLITWGDGTTQDQALAPHGRPLERPIQHVYRTVGAKTVKASGEHGCLGTASAALNVTVPLVRPAGSAVQAVHH